MTILSFSIFLNVMFFLRGVLSLFSFICNISNHWPYICNSCTDSSFLFTFPIIVNRSDLGNSGSDLWVIPYRLKSETINFASVKFSHFSNTSTTHFADMYGVLNTEISVILTMRETTEGIARRQQLWNSVPPSLLMSAYVRLPATWSADNWLSWQWTTNGWLHSNGVIR